MGAIDRHNSGKTEEVENNAEKDTVGSSINNYSSTSIEEHQAESKIQTW